MTKHLSQKHLAGDTRSFQHTHTHTHTTFYSPSLWRSQSRNFKLLVTSYPHSRVINACMSTCFYLASSRSANLYRPLGGKEAHSREAVEIPKMIWETEKKNCTKRHSVSVYFNFCCWEKKISQQRVPQGKRRLFSLAHSSKLKPFTLRKSRQWGLQTDSHIAFTSWEQRESNVYSLCSVKFLQFYKVQNLLLGNSVARWVLSSYIY